MLGAAEPKATARGQAPTLKKAEGGGHSQGLGPWCRQKTGAGSQQREGGFGLSQSLPCPKASNSKEPSPVPEIYEPEENDAVWPEKKKKNYATFQMSSAETLHMKTVSPLPSSMDLLIQNSPDSSTRPRAILPTSAEQNKEEGGGEEMGAQNCLLTDPALCTQWELLETEMSQPHSGWLAAMVGQEDPVQWEIHRDWANREYVEIITGSIKKIADFLNSFDMSCSSRLATLNEKLTALERRTEYIEARVKQGETLT
ncbi:hypothetical protein QTO34_018318 [Cnephaeus nilssonii]|uniref:Protein BRICK1 n=1 Tax=Cnephaeus nilssonii TaxID=3371016 RepID=A0AA40HZM7_CNENI|nr:hypothetical protein QTO34_018318 [Eptesicus nilssonii]